MNFLWFLHAFAWGYVCSWIYYDNLLMAIVLALVAHFSIRTLFEGEKDVSTQKTKK